MNFSDIKIICLTFVSVSVLVSFHMSSPIPVSSLFWYSIANKPPDWTTLIRQLF